MPESILPNLVKDITFPHLREKAINVMAELVSVYQKQNTFGNHCEILGGHDPLFTLGDWVRLFRYIPRLRKDLVLGFIWNTITSRKPSIGFCASFTPGKRYNFFHRSFCDLMIWEAMARSKEQFNIEWSEDLFTSINSNLSLLANNGRPMKFQGEPLNLFSYYPSRDHLIEPSNPAYAHFNSWDANVPDNDSTCIILSALNVIIENYPSAKKFYPHSAKDKKRHLELMKAHIYREGVFAKESLSYENGAQDQDSGVLTWIFDKHNELDPTSNINMLNYLLQIWLQDEFQEDSEFLMQKIFAFLLLHIRTQIFWNTRFQQYYPLGATYYFWYRLIKTYAQSNRWPKFIQQAIEEIEKAFEEKAKTVFVNGQESYNVNDWLSAAPWMLHKSLLPQSLCAQLLAEDFLVVNFKKNAFEIFHLLYPSKIICVAEKMPYACYLDALGEIIKHS